MTRKSKREIERELDNLDPDHDAEGGVIINMTWSGSDKSGSPRPELTVRGEKEERYTIATPNILPAKFSQRIVILSPRVRETWPGDPPEEDDETVYAGDLWDAMTEEQLKEEKHIREQNGDPLPPLLSNVE